MRAMAQQIEGRRSPFQGAEFGAAEDKAALAIKLFVDQAKKRQAVRYDADDKKYIVELTQDPEVNRNFKDAVRRLWPAVSAFSGRVSDILRERSPNCVSG